MKKYSETLTKCDLFANINTEDLQTLLTCLSATVRHYEKNEFIFAVDDRVTKVGVVLSGTAHIIQEDFWGNRTILANVSPGNLFGEAFSCAGTEKLPVSVVASQTSDVLFIDYNRIINVCSSACEFHAGLIRNMLGIIAENNVLLTQKIRFLTQHSTRDKLLEYLSAEAQQAESNAFDIPFNRQELADYLSVNRSALSNELSKMKNEGILTFTRNHFVLFETGNSS